MKWEEVKLNGLFEVKHGFAFKSEFFSESGKYAVTTPGHFYEAGGFRQREGKEKYYKGEFPPQYLLSKGDLIIAMTEQGEGLLGSTAIIPEDERYLHNQRLGLVINENKERIWKKFLYFLLNTYEYRATIASSATGTKVKHTSPSRILDLTVKLPPLPTQQKIASILSAYDDGIENNLKRIKLLEEAAQHLYREWFVKFRFPGWEAVRVVDGLPEGWERKALGEFCVVNQATISEKKAPETIHYIDISSTNTGYFEKPNEMPFKDAPSRARRIVKHGDTIFSTVRPNRKSYALILDPIENLVASTGFAVLTPKRIEDFPFVYLTVSSQDFVDRVSMVATGAAYPAVNQSDFEKMEIVVPDEKLRLAAFKTFEPIYLQKENLLKQNQRLKAGRDMLLPRLMGGVLAV